MRTNKRVGGIVFHDNKVLLIHRHKTNKKDYWVIPGGGVEDEETLEEALKREMLEETSTHVVDSQFVSSFKDGKRDHYFYTCTLDTYQVALGGPELEDNTPDNSYTLEWLPISEAIKLNLYPRTTRQVIQTYAH
jgi:ADP-ribose pyrophosphatase YjhB (NUDIX family)